MILVRTATRRAGLTLIEIVMATGVLVAVAAALLSMSSASITSARDAHGYFLAQETALRTVERLQSEAYSQAFLLYWDDANVTKRTINSKKWAVAGGPLDELQQPMVDAAATGRFGAPLSDPAFLRVRFLSEQEYANLWNVPDALADLDFNGSVDTSDPTTDCSFVGVVVEVHWQEQPGALGERMYQLRTVVRRNPVFDPSR